MARVLFAVAHAEVHTDLEHPGGRQVEDGHARSGRDVVQRDLHLFPGRADAGEPDIVGVFPQIIVRDARAGVDDCRLPVE